MNHVLDKNWLFEWTFKTRQKTLNAHKIHRYPATFIPELVQKIITTFSEKEDTVLDIFSGSGTALLESMALERQSIGIEMNPLGVMIAEVKTTYIEESKIGEISIDWQKNFLNNNYEPLDFHNMDVWYSPKTLKVLADLIGATNAIKMPQTRKLILVSISEILREISYCNHGGFKLHRSKDKLQKGMHLTKLQLLDKLMPVINRNIRAVVELEALDKNYTPKIIFSDSRVQQSKITPSSVDLILTSPPYGDSRTTVAYGQFSALSSQILGLKSLTNTPIRQLDNLLLGGSTKDINLSNVTFNSLTLNNIYELFSNRAKLADNSKEKEKIYKRLKDILSFYMDLEECIKQGASYLKQGGFFVLVTGSRIVHNTKLHTDIIIAELAINYNLKLKNIYYRDIHNKRMPSKVSATNIKGEKSPTMTEESIIILQKN